MLGLVLTVVGTLPFKIKGSPLSCRFGDLGECAEAASPSRHTIALYVSEKVNFLSAAINCCPDDMRAVEKCSLTYSHKVEEAQNKNKRGVQFGKSEYLGLGHWASPF